MKNIVQTSRIVKQVLEAVPEARNSDDLLYITVCGRINKDVLTMPFCQVMAMRKQLNIPPFESVRRARQKMQAEHPELAGSTEVEAHRILNEEIVKNYARG